MFRVRRRIIAGVLSAALFVPLLAASTVVASSVVDPFTSRFTTNARGSIELIGNTLMTCPAGSTCTDALNGVGGTLNNNDFSMVYVDIDSDASTFDSSSADLNLPARADVLFAGLYWGAASNDANRDQVQFKRPGHGYATVSASKVSVAGSTYAAFADVTADVVALGDADGTYSVANVQATEGPNQLAGWSLVIAYHDATAPLRNLTVFDGFVQINTTAPSELTTTVSGFITPTTGPVNAEVGMVTFEGDLNLLNDQFLLNGTAMSNAANPETNLFNSSISSLGSTVHAKNPDYLNQLGFDVDLLDGTGYIGNSDTSASLTFTTNGDFYYPTVLTFAVDVLEPEIIATKSQVDVNGGSLGPGDEIEYTIDLVNNGNDPATNVVLTDPIPAGTTYVPDSASIVSGPGAGSVTDAAGDDRGEYDAGNSQVVFRLGTGATASTGGVLAPSATTTVRFRVSADNGLAAGTPVENQAQVAYRGETLGEDFTAQSDGQANTPGDQPTVIYANSPPDAKNDSKTTAEDTPVDVDVLGNDTDPDGAGDLVPASVSVTNGPAHGSVSVNPATGVATYTPAANYFGDDSFTYQVCDTIGACDTAVVDLTVTPVPDPPVANDDSSATDQNTPVDVDVLGNDTDPDGLADLDPSSVAVTSGPAHGSVAINPATGVVTYTPANGYVGNDSFDYQVCDMEAACSSAAVSVGVAVGNRAPDAADDNANTAVDTPVHVNVLSNDTDPDGPADIDPSSVVVTSGPSHGQTSVNTATGAVTYTPDPNFNGPDQFDYQVCDLSGMCDTATVDITVAAAPGPPVAADDSAVTQEATPVDIDVLANDNDPDGWADLDPGSVAVTAGPSHGQTSVDPDTGVVTYTPDAGYKGVDTFTYQVCDAAHTCDSAEVTIGVAVDNMPPVAADDQGTTAQGTPLDIDVLANDTDPDGPSDIDPTSVSVTAGPSHGQTSVNPTTGVVTYTPDPGYSGPDSFKYEVCDQVAQCDTATVDVTVQPPGAPPTANDDSATTTTNVPVTIDVLANDVAGLGQLDPTSVTIVDGPSHGLLSVDPDSGAITYQPYADYNGPDSFTYRVCDTQDACATAQVSVTVLLPDTAAPSPDATAAPPRWPAIALTALLMFGLLAAGFSASWRRGRFAPGRGRR